MDGPEQVTEDPTTNANDPVESAEAARPSEGSGRIRRDTVPTESVLAVPEILPPPPPVPMEAGPSGGPAGGPPRLPPMSGPPPLPPRPTQSLRRNPPTVPGMPAPGSQTAGTVPSSQPPARLGRTMPPPAATPVGSIPRPPPSNYRPALPPRPGAVRTAATQRLGTQPGVATPVGARTPLGGAVMPRATVALPPNRPPSFPPPGRASVPPSDIHDHLAQLASRTHAARDAIGKHDGDIRSLRTQVGLLDARVTEMEEGGSVSLSSPPAVDLAARIAEVERVVREFQGDLGRQAEALGLAATRIAELTELLAARERSEEPARAPRASSVPAAPDGEASDDLRAIKGIGPKFEEALRSLGVTRYAQIAAWTSADVERIADALGIKAQRIERAGWVEVAQRLIAD